MADEMIVKVDGFITRASLMNFPPILSGLFAQAADTERIYFEIDLKCSKSPLVSRISSQIPADRIFYIYRGLNCRLHNLTE